MSASGDPLGLADTRPSAAPAPVDVSAATEVDAVTETHTTDRLSLALPGDGARMGRFVLLDRVGAGAMGVVYAAYDSTLDRKVAIKLIRGSGGGEDRLRIRREAQAMARMSHTNVAQIYEAGEFDGRLYLAMEYIDGEGLDLWQEDDHAWPALLDQYRGVGAGLAAAHAAGILHRDFKPHNVLVGRDGRPRVIDFGLARAPGAAEVERRLEEDDDTAQVSLRHAVTQEGTVVGTPAYMALEQFMGRPLDARTDQFAFCVALYEAVYGEPPYPRESLPALLAALKKHQVRPPPAESDVPRWLHAALVRGLAPEPNDRWPSMDALLAELSRDRDTDPATGRGQRLLFVVVVGLVAVGVSLTAIITNHFQEPDPDVALAYGWIVAGVTYAGLFVVRRTVLTSTYNLRVTAFFFSAVSLVAFSRTVSWVLDAPGNMVYVLENVGLTALGAFAAITVARWFWTLTGAIGIGVILTALFPERQDIFYSMSITAACCLAVAFTLERRPPAEKSR